MQHCDQKVYQKKQHNNIAVNFITIDEKKKYRIDRNTSLILNTIVKGFNVMIEGTICYQNGLQLKVPSKYWKMISHYNNIENITFQFVYNFERESVSVVDRLQLPVNHCIPKQKIERKIEHKRQQILKAVHLFVQNLYLYGIIGLKGKFHFRQLLEETILHKNINSKLTESLHNNLNLNNSQFSSVSSMVDENKQLHDDSNVLITPIQILKEVPKFIELPMQLQSGPKNIRYQFTNGSEVNKANGGFYEIQKILCVFDKKTLQTKKSNLHSINQNSTQTNSQSQYQGSKTNYSTNILVRKSLKPDRQQTKINRLKITKELIIVEQIKNKTHLINYYFNSNQIKSKFKDTSLGLVIKDTQGQFPLSLFGKFHKIEGKQKGFPLQLPEVYMDFHPHTLDDFTQQPYNSIDSRFGMCMQFLESVIHLHESKVIHRDLKPQNALIDYSSQRFSPILKLIDFSESAIFKNGTQRFYNQRIPLNCIDEIFQKHNPKMFAATMPYSPPQCQLQRQHSTSSGVNNFKIDSWSMGMILPEILTGKKLLNYSRPYADDVMYVLKEVGFQNYNSKKIRRGFGIIQTLVAFIALRNVTYDPSKRMDVGKCYEVLGEVEKKLNQWTSRFNSHQLVHKPQHLLKC